MRSYQRLVPFLLAFVVAACLSTNGRMEGFRSLSDTPHGYRVVSSPVRAGAEAQRFEVRPGDCGADASWSDCANDRERSEISLADRFPPGTDRWVGFSLYLPPNFQTSRRVATTLGQIHQSGGPSGTAGGLPSFPPLVQLEVRGNSYRACLHILSGPANDVRDRCRYFDLARVSDMLGRWTDVLIHLDSRGGGVLEIFVDGTRRAQARDFLRFRPEEFFVKYGIYRSFVSRHGGPMPTQVAYFDEVRITNNRAAATPDSERPVD